MKINIKNINNIRLERVSQFKIDTLWTLNLCITSISSFQESLYKMCTDTWVSNFQHDNTNHSLIFMIILVDMKLFINMFQYFKKYIDLEETANNCLMSKIAEIKYKYTWILSVSVSVYCILLICLNILSIPSNDWMLDRFCSMKQKHLHNITMCTAC